MKKIKNVIAVLSALTTLSLSAMSAFAEASDKSQECDFTVQEGRRTYYCYLDDNNDFFMKVPDGISYESVTNFNGIVFETNGDVDVSKLDLKYEFTNSDIFSYNTANISLGHNQSHVENIYSCQINGDLSELEAYANEISKMEGIKYAEVFTVDFKEYGSIYYTYKDDCRVMIFPATWLDSDEYMQKLNGNKELMEYLASVGADPEVKKMENDKYGKNILYVSIKDRTKCFDVLNGLRKFEDIGSNANMMCKVLIDNNDVSFDFIGRDYSGNANDDKYINVRDCAAIASMLAKGEGSSLPETADYNHDGKKNVRDAAALAAYLAK